MPIGGIGRALGQGVTNLARGVAQSSQNWPQLGMQQRRLDQQQSQFEQTEDRLGKDYNIRLANTLIAQGGNTLDMVDKLVEANDTEGAAAMVRQYLDSEQMVTGLLLQPSDEALTADVADTILPGIAPPAALDGIPGGPPRPESSRPISIATNLVSGNRRNEHNTIMKLRALQEVAQRGGVSAGLNFYAQAMGKNLTPELREQAKSAIQAMASVTAKERLQLRREEWNNTWVSARDKGVLSWDLWDGYVMRMNELGGLSQEEAENNLKQLRSQDARAKFSEVQERHLAQSATIKRHAADALAQMTNKELTDMMGGLEGIKSTILNKFPGAWKKLSEGDKQETLDYLRKSTNLRNLVNTLASGTDFMTRMMTGAALTEAEQIFYGTLIGTISDQPHLIRQNLRNLIRNLGHYETKIWTVYYQQKVGRPDIFQDVEQEQRGRYSTALSYGEERGPLGLEPDTPGSGGFDTATASPFEQSY